MISNQRIALYTTVYPSVEKYLLAWYNSVANQADKDFDIWIGVDGLTKVAVTTAIGEEIAAKWVFAAAGMTPAQVRQAAFIQIVSQYAAVVFVDSDDVLAVSRVAAAREALRISEVNGCSLQLVDEAGSDLGAVFRPASLDTAVANLPRTNVFGLSNTAYRTDILRQCLPIPKECVLVDWYLATRAWALGAQFSFDFDTHMAYRQHPNNIALVMPPFSAQWILLATNRVLAHARLTLNCIPELSQARRLALMTTVNEVDLFYKAVAEDDSLLQRYVQALNHLELEIVWWACVAHPKLEWLWKN